MVPGPVVVPPVSGLFLVAMVLPPMSGSRPFGRFGFAFFFGDFGAELGVFFVFDRAAGFFGFDFFPVFGFVAFFAGFGFFVFFRGRGGQVARQDRQAQRVRRGGGGDQREQQQDQQEGEELAHRPFIGTAAAPL